MDFDDDDNWFDSWINAFNGRKNPVFTYSGLKDEPIVKAAKKSFGFIKNNFVRGDTPFSVADLIVLGVTKDENAIQKGLDYLEDHRKIRCVYKNRYTMPEGTVFTDFLDKQNIENKYFTSEKEWQMAKAEIIKAYHKKYGNL